MGAARKAFAHDAVFLQRLGHLSAETLMAPRLVVLQWFGRLGVEALTKIGLKARRHRGHVVRISSIDPCCRPGKVRQRRRNRRPFHPKNGRSKWFSQTHRVLSHQSRIASRPPANQVGAVNAFRTNLRLTFVVAEDGYRVL
jgi:hypothetical protein